MWSNGAYIWKNKIFMNQFHFAYSEAVIFRCCVISTHSRLVNRSDSNWLVVTEGESVKASCRWKDTVVFIICRQLLVNTPMNVS